MTVAELAQESRDHRRITTLLTTLAAVAVVALAWGIPHIEAELTTVTETALAERGWSGLSVDFSGRDATVAGTVDIDPAEIAETVASIDGVRVVHLRVETPERGSVAPEQVPVLGEPRVTLSISPSATEPGTQTVIMSGSVPSALVTELAAEAAAAVAAGGTVMNNLEVAPVRDALWLTRLDEVLQALDGTGDVSVVLGEGRAVVTGTVVSDAQVERIRIAIQAAVAPELDVVTQLKTSAVLGAVVQIVTDGERIDISGRLPEAASTALAALAGQVFGPADAVLDITTEGVMDAIWLDTLRELVPQLTQASDLLINIDDVAVSATGSVASPDLVTAVEAALTTIGEVIGAEPFLDVRFDPAAAAKLCPPEELNALVAGGLLFESNRADLTREGFEALDQVAERLQRCEGVVVEVGGHTDDIGDASYNQFLSEQRAQTVVDRLVAQGVDPERLIPVGYGETEPIADNGTSEGRALNRRIEFTLVGGP